MLKWIANNNTINDNNNDDDDEDDNTFQSCLGVPPNSGFMRIETDKNRSS